MTLDDFDIYVYDFEVFAHDWLVVLKDASTGEYHEFWQEGAEALGEFMAERGSALFVSYNGSHYDQWVMKAIMAGCDPEQVKEVNDAIIAGGDDPIWEHSYLAGARFRFNDVDLMKDTQVGTSLKSIEGHLGMSIEESSVDFTVTHRLSGEERAEVAHYCRHDVDATEELLRIRRGYLETKLALGERAGLDPARALYMTNAKLTAAVLGAEPEEYGDERAYVVPGNLLREHVPAEALAFFARVGDGSVPDEELWSSKLSLDVGGCPVTLGFGGIHGALPRYREEARDGRAIVNIDVSSYYPSLMVRNGYTSRSMASPETFRGIYEERLAAKAAGDKATANALKLIVNTTYGATLNRYNDLYDPLMARSVCISGQLYLLELASHLASAVPGLRLVQLNTDGVMVSVGEGELDLVREIYHEWERRTGFELEEDDIALVWQKDVNNYAMRTTDGGTKLKGGYLVRGTSKAGAFSVNNNATVVADALRAWLLDGTPVEETVMGCDDPAAFQLIAKAGHKYSRVYQERLLSRDGDGDGEWGQVDVQRCNRVFATRDETLGRLYKVKAANGQVAKVESLPEHCLIRNGGMPDMSEVDRGWYVELARRRAKDFEEAEMAATKKAAPDYAAMNVWQKLALARKMVAESGITKSGVNDYAGWTYMELGDVTKVQNEVFSEVGLVELFTMCPAQPSVTAADPETGEERLVAQALPALAVSTVVNVDQPSQKIEFTLAWREVESIVSKKTGQASQNALQRQGSEQTYLRRYLKMQVLDLAVPDEIDSAPEPKVPARGPQGPAVKAAPKPKAKPKAARPASAGERAEAAKALTDPEAAATQLQVRQLKKAIRTVMDAHKGEPEVSAYVAQLSAETDQLKGEVSKRRAEEYLTRLGELKEKYDAAGGKE